MVLDSSFSFQLYPIKSLFYKYKSIDDGRLLIGNNDTCKIVGIGSIKIRMFDGIIRTLHDVRHALRLKEIGSLQVWWIRIKCVKKNGLYVLKRLLVLMSATIPIMSQVDRPKLWHIRLGHMSVKGM